MKRPLSYGLCAAAVTAALSFSAQAVKVPGEPLQIAQQGYFFVGGEYHTGANGQTYMSGQAYVEFQLPTKVKHPYPIVMLEGFGLTGTNFKGTTDGREGWEQFFLRNRYAVYTVDQPGRGRSPWITDKYGTPGQPISAEGQQSGETTPELFNRYPKAHLHNQWPGTGLPGDEAFDQLYASQVPAFGAALYEPLNRKAFAELLDRIGPAIIIGHSQGGLLLWLIADERPDLVKGLVALEPGGPPFHSARFIGPPNWFEDGPASFPWGITTGPITYDPPAASASELSFVQEATAQSPDLVRCWRQAEPARTLPNLQGIPTVIVSSEASSAATRDHCTSQYLEQAGVPNTHLRLEDVGLYGNGHMMMLEKNSLEVAQAIKDWLYENVERPPSKPK